MRDDKLRLPTVTLVSVDTACHDLTAVAVNDCLDKAEFGEVLVLSDKRLSVPGAQHHFMEPTGNVEATVRAYWYVVPPLLTTEHFMVVHWDSGIVNANRWRREFIEYDYIGAPWWYGEDRNVGNGGFSIRSARLANHLAGSTLPFSNPEDDAICRRYRPKLEQSGFTWASPQIAGHFAFERVMYYPKREIFGYHGMFNWPLVFTGEQIEERVAKAPPYVLDNVHYHQMRMVQAGLKGMVA